MSDADSWAESLGHVHVSGATGSRPDTGGKTVTANYLHERSVWSGEFDLAVYFDPEGYSWIRGPTCRSVADMADEISSGERVLHYVPPADLDATREHMADVYRFLEATPDDVTVWATWDESPEYDDVAELERAVRRGGNGHGIKSVCLSQRPTDLSTDVRSQLLTLVWIGPVTGDLRGYSQRRGEAASTRDGTDWADVVETRHSEPFMWTAFDGGMATTYRPVPAEYGP